MEPKVEFAMQTPDAQWRVEVVKRGTTRWYRVRHDDSEIDWLAMATMERILAEAGIDLADLIEVTGVVDEPVDNGTHGAA